MVVMRHLRLFVFIYPVEQFDFVSEFQVQLGDLDFDHVFIGVGDNERCELLLHAGQDCVDADISGVEVDLGDEAFVLQIKKIARVVCIKFEHNFLRELTYCVGNEQDFGVLFAPGLLQARLGEDAEHFGLRFAYFVLQKV